MRAQPDIGPPYQLGDTLRSYCAYPLSWGRDPAILRELLTQPHLQSAVPGH